MPKTAITGSLVNIGVDKDDKTPIYQQITEGLKRAIETGQLAAGSKLPSTRVFAEELGVSRNTVLQVFEGLTDVGLLVSRVGAGTFVRDMVNTITEATPAFDVAPERRAYPFRSLSRRGKALVASSTDEFTERPTAFMPDLPDLREFPIRTWLRLLNETSGRLTGQILGETSNAGYEPLRRAIAQHLSAARGILCDYRQVVITTGSQQGLDLICRMLLDAGDPVWIEEPCYMGTRSIIRANGGIVCPVPVDADGFSVDDAVDRLPVPRLICVSPSRQYPLGAQLATSRRAALLEVAQRSGAFIVEDDYDCEFFYQGSAAPAIYGTDGAARTIYMGTFSKILLPSFRLGYLVVPSDFRDAFARARAVVDRHASLIEQMVLSEFMNRGLFASHVRRMRSLYQARRNHLLSGLETLFGSGCCASTPNSGTHLVLPLAAGCTDVALARRAAERGLVLRPLSPYYMTDRVRPGLLFGFSSFNEAEISRALELLSDFRSQIEVDFADGRNG